MSVSIRSGLKTLLLSQRTDQTAIKEVSKQSLDHFQRNIEEIAEFVAKEAMKGNYYRLNPIDIQRGLDKWHESKIIGKLKIAIG